MALSVFKALPILTILSHSSKAAYQSLDSSIARGSNAARESTRLPKIILQPWHACLLLIHRNKAMQ
jgi:hypothetical protein